MRTPLIVSIDRFNFYYGAIKDGLNKWLNLQKYFTLLRQCDDIQKIVYCTAMVDGPDGARQQTCLDALATLPLVEVVLGRYKLKQVKCMSTACSHSGSRWLKTPEEKRTDVNIAIRLLEDAYEGRCQRQIIVSGDSDLVPAVDAVKRRAPNMKVIVYVPSRDPAGGAATELRGAADDHRNVPTELLRHAQFPAVVIGGDGNPINKPIGW